ncbi:MAG: hypothetical protein KAG95_02800 [Bacteroidales bacterium]|nr:hypothetical protein [Bacteroidales bacterium]
MRNKLFTLFCLILFTNISAYSQKDLKYKNVFKSISQTSDKQSFSLLIQYQKQDPFCANAYYQLGNIAFRFSKQYDPLTEFSDVCYFVYHTKLYLELAKKYTDSKEARSHCEYYNNIKLPEGQKRVTAENIINNIDSIINDIVDFKKNVYPINKYFNAGIDKYNYCIANFKEINNKHNKIKNVYLTTDKQFIDNIQSIKTSYDSTIYYLNKYREGIKKYPIKNYNQQYSIQPIVTYRLDGLTYSDFFDKNFNLWDYSKWVNQVMKIISGDIVEIRNEIAEKDKELTTLCNVVSKNRTFGVSFEKPKVENNLIYKIGKYDHKSVMTSLLKYKEAKINFLINKQNIFNDIHDTVPVPVLKRAGFYRELLGDKQKAEQYNLMLNNCISPLNVSKYKNFINNEYKGIKSFKEYADEEIINNDKILQNSFDNYKFYILKEEKKYKSNFNFITYHKQQIPAFITAFDKDRPVEQYYTTNIIKTKSGEYLAGYYKNKDKSTIAYIAKTNLMNKIVWLKKYKYNSDTLGKLNSYSILLHNFDDEVFCTICSISKNDSINYVENHLIKIDEFGKEITNSKLANHYVPRYFLYDDINKKIIFAYKGNSLKKLNNNYEDLVVEYCDSSCYSLWKQTFKLKGNIFDIIKTNENYTVFGNFSKLENKESNEIIEIKQKSDKTPLNIFSCFINKLGEIKKVNIYNSKPSYFGLRALKLNSKEINVVGINGFSEDINDQKNNNNSTFFYLLTNEQGEKIYSNF